MGTWTYVYDGVGQLLSQTDAKGQVTTMTYDKLGRKLTQAEPSLNSVWTYDKYEDLSACNKGLGKLCEVSSLNGYRKKIVYDSVGRTSSTTTTVGSNFTTSQTYDVNGRTASVTYPSGLMLTRQYTTRGYLRTVTDSRTGGMLWRADTVNAAGQVTQSTHGNGIVSTRQSYPGTGRLNTSQAGPANSVLNIVHSYTPPAC
jgi:YD repeat-containing protein